MVVGSPAHKKAVQSLWAGKATITVLDGVLNPANGRTEPQERILAVLDLLETALEADGSN